MMKSSWVMFLVKQMKFKLFGFRELIINQTYFFDGLRRRLKLIQTIVNIKGAMMMLVDVRSHFKANIPLIYLM